MVVSSGANGSRTITPGGLSPMRYDFPMWWSSGVYVWGNP
jgi:hypothetical protein